VQPYYTRPQLIAHEVLFLTASHSDFILPACAIMPPKPKGINWPMYTKMFVTGTTICIGGPALIYWVTPTEEELFLKYNPDLQKRSLENRIERQQDFNNFVGKLKEYSKSDKPIWEAAADDERKSRDGMIQEQLKLMEEMRARKEEMRKHTSPMPGGSL